MFRRHDSIRHAIDACGDHRQVILLEGQPCVVRDTVVRQLQIDGATVQPIQFDGLDIIALQMNPS